MAKGGSAMVIDLLSGQAPFRRRAFTATATEPAIGKPVDLFVDMYATEPAFPSPNYDVTADGRFIVTKREAAT